MRTLDTDCLLSDPANLWLDTQDPAEPVEADPLSMALPWLVRHLGVAAAVEAVVGPVDGLPGQDGPGADRILPALRRIGFDARMAQRPLADLRATDLPAVLLLRNGDACVLTKRHIDSDGQALCTVIMPGPQVLELLATDDDISAEYSGVALLVSRPKPPVRVAGRAPFGLVQRAEPSSLSALAAAIHIASQAMEQVDREAAVPAAPTALTAQPGRIQPEPVALAKAEPPPQRARTSSKQKPNPVAPTKSPVAAEPRILPKPSVLPEPLDRLCQGQTSAPDFASQLAAQTTTAIGALSGLQPNAQPDQPTDVGVVLELSFMNQPSATSAWRPALAGLCARCGQAKGKALALWRRVSQARTRPASIKLSLPRDSLRMGPRALSLGMGQRLERARTGLAAWAARAGQAVPASSLAAMPLWLGMYGVCLLIGAPLAWARMVSVSSLQAAATLVPGLLRDALAADQDRAVLALARQDQARLPAPWPAVAAGLPMLIPARTEAQPAALAEAPPVAQPAALTAPPKAMAIPALPESPAKAEPAAGQATEAARLSVGRSRTVPRRVSRMH